METTKLLKNYNLIKVEIDLIEARIKMLNDLLKLNDVSGYIVPEFTTRKKALIKRPTENEVVYKDTINDKLAREYINKEIQDLLSKLISKKNKIDIINLAIKALTAIQKYIIECIYFHKMTLQNVVISLQNHKIYKNKNIWCIQTVVNQKNKAIKIINSIVKNYLNFGHIPCM